jgi:uncharacterized protein
MQLEPVPPPLEEVKPQPTRWGGWTTVGFSAAIFGVFFAAQNLVAVIFVAVLFLQNPSIISNNGLMEFLTGIQSNGLLLSTAIVVSGICGFFMVWLFIKIRHGYSFKNYLEFKALGWKTWVSLLAVTAGLIVFSFFMDKVHSDTNSLKIMADAYRSSGWPPFFWIATIVFAPVFEETLFRGFLFVGLQNSRVGPAWTVIITAIPFAVLHALQYDYFGLIIILVLGLVFGMVRLFSKSLWSTIALHVAWNLMAMISLTMYVKGLV